MSEITTILMKPKSGMTTAAVALVNGLINRGVWAYLVVPTIADANALKGLLPDTRVKYASDVRALTMPSPDVLVFDDATSCAEVWLKHGEGSMLDCALTRFDSRLKGITTVYLFQHTI